ncbi:MAG: vacuolar protein sorting-associated protein 74 [Amphiamblys sp. WSBS2006]|nr:MAG: vacuolar protein sorting-associated protein 74 [Amphiamblys sp. WSBS2006]
MHEGGEIRHRGRAKKEPVDEAGLTLYEKLFVLALHDRKGRVSYFNDMISPILRGCILIELHRRGRIEAVRDPEELRPRKQKLRAVGTEKTGEGLLDETMEAIYSSPPMAVSDWVKVLSKDTWTGWRKGLSLGKTRERIAKGLLEKRILDVEKTSLFVFEWHIYPLRAMKQKAAIAEKVVKALEKDGGAPSQEISILTCCVAAGGFFAEMVPKETASRQRELSRKAWKYLEKTIAAQDDAQNITIGVLTCLYKMAGEWV